ncbi:hypothetical protein ABPG72_008875 [Tetrahymena utriculariae]
MDSNVVNFDKQLENCTQVITTIKQLTVQRNQAIQQKNNQPIMKIEYDLRQNIENMKQQIPKLQQSCDDLCRNNNKYKITKQESEKRMNQFQNLKNQFIQSEQAAFAIKRKIEIAENQEKLFQGRTNDIELQDMSSYEIQQHRSALQQKENQAIDSANELVESLIGKQKQVGQMLVDSKDPLEHINKRADQVNQKMENMSGKFEDLLRTTSNNTLWIIIIVNIFILVFLISL